MKDGSDPVVRPNAVYNQMGLLLKSLLCVSRVLPAYKFARSQGPDTHVMCYRVFAGEPSSNPLGSGQQTAHVSVEYVLVFLVFLSKLYISSSTVNI